MTFACTDCSQCGKCYEKNSTCAKCGGAIYLLDDACPTCGEPITDAMRDSARAAYIAEKKKQKQAIFQLAAAAKAKREAEAKKRQEELEHWKEAHSQ